MSEIVLLIVVFAVLWIFWAWLGALFDAISDHHLQAAARREPESHESHPSD